MTKKIKNKHNGIFKIFATLEHSRYNHFRKCALSSHNIVSVDNTKPLDLRVQCFSFLFTTFWASSGFLVAQKMAARTSNMRQLHQQQDSREELSRLERRRNDPFIPHLLEGAAS